MILHTNLGRAPLAAEAVDAAVAAARYATLEWDPATGGRSRQDHLAGHLRALTGAESACVATSNAAAVLLALVALGGGGVIVSRGQLVEIGGGFRVPGAGGIRVPPGGGGHDQPHARRRLRAGDRPGHPGDPARARLELPRRRVRRGGADRGARGPRERAGLALVDDLGSGVLRPDAAVAGEPDAAASVAAGCDLVAFSADKLIGGPQAGILVGTAAAVSAPAPLMRALRPDKLILAALVATLALHRDPRLARAHPRPPGAPPGATGAAGSGRAPGGRSRRGGRGHGRPHGGGAPARRAPELRRGARRARSRGARGGPARGGSRRGEPAQGRARAADVLALSDEDLASLPALVAEARR